MTRPRKLRVPAEPLLEYVDLREGLADVLTSAGIEAYRWSEASEDWIPTATYRRYEKALDRGEERGWFDLYWVDDFLVRMFGIHPSGVYPDWFEIGNDRDLQDRLAGREPAAA